jgi:CheY-like chemotaxis protein
MAHADGTPPGLSRRLQPGGRLLTHSSATAGASPDREASSQRPGECLGDQEHPAEAHEPEITMQSTGSKSSRQHGGRAKTILIAEDDDLLRVVLAELLLEEGYRVLEADNGPRALQLAEREEPDVLVLDLWLPWRSGLEVLRNIRTSSETAHMPVIVVSGALDFEVRATLAHPDERADGVLEKPLDVGRLFAEVERAVGPPASANSSNAALSTADPKPEAGLPRILCQLTESVHRGRRADFFRATRSLRAGFAARLASAPGAWRIVSRRRTASRMRAVPEA